MEEILIKNDLSPNQYFYLVALYTKIRPNYKIHPDEVRELFERSFLVKGELGGKSLSRMAKGIFATNDNELVDLFENIWNLYPRKTPNGRSLRPANFRTQIGRVAFKKMKKQLVDYNNYENIVKALKTEIARRSKTRGLNYMQHISTWINQRTWESYVDEEESDEDSSVFDLG